MMNPIHKIRKGAINLTLNIIMLAVGIIVAVVALNALIPVVSGSGFSCPVEDPQNPFTGLAGALHDACNLFSNLGGAFIIIVAIIGIIGYLALVRGRS